jgi:hypothetical protein
VQLVIFLPTFNAPCIRPKIRCDSYYAKNFESFWYLNRRLGKPGIWTRLSPKHQSLLRNLVGFSLSQFCVWPAGAVSSPFRLCCCQTIVGTDETGARRTGRERDGTLGLCAVRLSSRTHASHVRGRGHHGPPKEALFLLFPVAELEKNN